MSIFPFQRKDRIRFFESKRACSFTLFFHFFILFFSFSFEACSPSRHADVDVLNDQAYFFHYRSLDSTEVYAHQALTLSADYDDGFAEACNHLAFVYTMRMDYDGAWQKLEEVLGRTDNQLEILVANVQQMRICQRESRNKEFYDYMEKASKALQRIEEEKDMLDLRQQSRLIYAESEFHIVASTYYYYVGQPLASTIELEEIDPNGPILRDTCQYLNYLYQVGAGGILTKETSGNSIAQEEFDYLLRCFLLASHSGVVFWQANALQGISEHMFDVSSRDNLIADNLPAMKFLNDAQMPDSLLPGYLAQKSLEMFASYGDVYQIAGAYRTLASCYWTIGDFNSAIICLESALQQNEAISRAPDLVASIRERLSLTYSAIDDKQGSDFNRNAYLDLQMKTRQDSELEARAEQLNRSSRQLNWMITAVMLMMLAVSVSLFIFDYMRKRKARRNPLSSLLEPLETWQEENEGRIRDAEEQQEEIREALTLSQMSIAKNKKQNLENRAKLFLVNSIMPFIDRMKNEVNRLKSSGEQESVRHERVGYMAELADKINDYNLVLTQWIQLQQGQLSLHIESFKVQDLFDMIQRSRMSFKMKGVELIVEPTEATVKADRILTLFMVNTLADNARKFTPAGGRVTVSATDHPEEGWIELSIADTGVGIPADILTSIFDHKVSGGHGFGLMNCKGIIEKYRKVSQIFNVCSISATSKVGHGSRFSFRLPRGIMRLLLALSFSLPFQTSTTMAQPTAAGCVDSVYECNLHARYRQALAYADSAVMRINQLYTQTEDAGQYLMSFNGQDASSAAEMVWYVEEAPMDYKMILFLRNEIAVAALALHDWQLYTYNNKVYTQLYKLTSADKNLGKYVETMRQSELNKNIAVILLVILFFAMMAAYYLLYYRHQLYFRFCMEKVERINEMLLSNHTDEEKLQFLNGQFLQQKSFPPELQNIVEKIRCALTQSVQTARNQQVSIELAEDECRRAEYENQKLYVCNNVLDNCLSTLKHETMYYPNRVRQLIDEIGTDGPVPAEKIESIDELVTYYKDLYTLLSAQAMRQLDGIKHDCRPLSVHGAVVLGDPTMMELLFDILSRQSGEKHPKVDIAENDGRYVTFRLQMPQLAWRDFFVPTMDNIPFLICRQIVRENSESTNRRGCGIVALPADVGTCFAITLSSGKEKVGSDSGLPREHSDSLTIAMK